MEKVVLVFKKIIMELFFFIEKLAYVVEIGDNVIIGGNTTILDSNSHTLEPRGRKHGELDDSKITGIKIENDVWIGSNCMICPNVKIGRDSVIRANSVVRNNLSPYFIWIGNPFNIIGFNLFPEQIIDYEKFYYDKLERLSKGYLDKNVINLAKKCVKEIIKLLK